MILHPIETSLIRKSWRASAGSLCRSIICIGLIYPLTYSSSTGALLRATKKESTRERATPASDDSSSSVWTEYKIPGSATIGAISVLSPHNIFAFGGSTVFHFDGSSLRVIYRVRNASILSFDTDGTFALMVLDSLKERLQYSTPSTFASRVVTVNGHPHLTNFQAVHTDLHSGPQAVGFLKHGLALLVSAMEYGTLSLRHEGVSVGLAYTFQRHEFLDFTDYSSFLVQQSGTKENLTVSSLEKVATASVTGDKVAMHMLLSLRSLHHQLGWEGEVPFRHSISVLDSSLGAVVVPERVIFFERDPKTGKLRFYVYRELKYGTSVLLPTDIANIRLISPREAWAVTQDGIVFRTTGPIQEWGEKPWRQETVLPMHASGGMSGMTIASIDSSHILFVGNTFLVLNLRALRLNPEWRERQVPPAMLFQVRGLGRGTTYGIGLRDVDNNGYDDIFLINAEGNDRLYLRGARPERTGTDVNDAQERGMQGKGTGSGEHLETVETGVLLADLQEDGSQDALIAHLAGSNRLYQNDGAGYFRDVTTQSGVDVDMDRSEVVIGGDVDNDGYLDVFMTSFFGSNRLLINRGDGTFRDRTTEAGLTSGGRTTTAVFGDVNGDGSLDLYVGNAVSGHTLYINKGNGTFRDATKESGLGEPLPKFVNSSLFADFNNDGALDLLVGTRGDGLRLYLNSGKGAFTDVSQEAHVVFPAAIYGMAFGDFNNDGLLDIFVSYLGGVRLLLNTGIDTRGIPHFRDASSMIEEPIQQIATGYNTGLATFDDLHDGDLDIVAGQYGGFSYMLENILNDRPNKPLNFITVDVTGFISNRDAIGAKVSLFHNDSLAGFREVCAGYGYMSTSTKEQHFGLRDTTGSYTIEVDFPASGIKKRVIVKPGSRIEVREAENIVATKALAKKWLVRFFLSKEISLELLKLLLLLGLLVAIGLSESFLVMDRRRSKGAFPMFTLDKPQLLAYPVIGYVSTVLLVNIGENAFLGHQLWIAGTRSVFVEDALPYLVAFGVLAAAVARRREQEFSTVTMRLRIASDLHDEIGSDLSSIVMASQMLRNKAQLTPHDHTLLWEVGKTAMQTASKMRDIVWFINPEHDNVDDLLLKMKDFSLGMLKNIDYEFRAPKHSIPSRLTPEVRRNVLLVYKEVVNNAAKHSHASKVEVDVQVVDSLFALSVTDNGVGFDEALVKKGEGLQNLRKRASDIGGTLEILSRSGKGTHVTLKVKIT